MDDVPLCCNYCYSDCLVVVVLGLVFRCPFQVQDQSRTMRIDGGRGVRTDDERIEMDATLYQFVNEKMSDNNADSGNFE